MRLSPKGSKSPRKRVSKAKRKRAYELLETLLHREHCGGCDDTTCSIRVAFHNGQTLWAAYEFSTTGAASQRFLAIVRYVAGKAFDAQVERERKTLIKTVSHAECACGAYVWELDWNNGHCSNCGGNVLKRGARK